MAIGTFSISQSGSCQDLPSSGNPQNDKTTDKTNDLFLENFCHVCKKPAGKKRCSRCKTIYCSVACQKQDWTSNHKDLCKKIMDSFQKSPAPMPIDSPQKTTNLPIDDKIPKRIRKHVDLVNTMLSLHPFEYFRIRKNYLHFGLHFWGNCTRVIGNELVEKVKKSYLQSSEKIIEVDKTLFLKELPTHIGNIERLLREENGLAFLPQLENMTILLQELIENLSMTIDNSSRAVFDQSWEKISSSIASCGYYSAQKIDRRHVPHKVNVPAKLDADIVQKLSCFQYALIKAQHDDAILFFSKLGNRLPFINEFYKAGYTNVAIPQNGDLIVYFKRKVAKTLEKVPITHMGIWRDGDLIESKTGNELPFVFISSPLDRSSIYGRNFAIFRKAT